MLGFDLASWGRFFCVLPLVILLWWLAIRAEKRARIAFPLELVSGTHVPKRASRFSLLSRLLLAVGLIAILLSLAGLERTYDLPPIEKKEVRDIVLLLDLSLSMESYWYAKDLTMLTRLDLIAEFSRLLTFLIAQEGKENRISVMVFGDLAFGVLPLSNDYALVIRILDNFDKLLPSQLRGTKIALGLDATLKHLDDQGTHAAQMIVLLTDGLDTLETEDRERLFRAFEKREHPRSLVLGGIGLPASAAFMRFCESLSHKLCLSDLTLENAQRIVSYMKGLLQEAVFVEEGIATDYMPTRVASTIGSACILLWLLIAIGLRMIPITVFSRDR